VPVVERAAYPVGLGAHFITIGEILGGRYALPRDAAMTKWVDELKNWLSHHFKKIYYVTVLKGV
jgi:hypothetical protein